MHAEQWFPEKSVAGVLDLRHATNIRRGSRRMSPGAYVETLSGPISLSPGDWVVTDDNGVLSVRRNDG